MNARIGGDDVAVPGFSKWPLVGALMILVASAFMLPAAVAAERDGKTVVAEACASCHAAGAKGAPQIGDSTAWGKRAAQGLSSQTRNAIAGIRSMPPHGGSATVSDLEISRAITYMVNQSGGKWIEPVDRNAKAVERSGEQIVTAHCATCHQSGANGAPKIGDRDAWVPRLEQGFDVLVRSAIKGHGPMPARGGVADLTDREMRNAIAWLFHPTVAKPVAPAAVAAASADLHRKVVGGTEILLGIVPVASIRAMGSGPESRMHGGIPSGDGQYHVNISLFDAKSGNPVTNAQVEARIDDPAMRAETKALELVGARGAISYGNYFRMPTRGQYRITVRIVRPDTPNPVEVRFDYKA